MSWNYRVMRSTDPDGSHHFAIHEVYYDDENNCAIKAWSVDAVAIGGESFKELTEDAANYQRAFGQHILAISADGNELHDIGVMGHAKKPKLVYQRLAATPHQET